VTGKLPAFKVCFTKGKLPTQWLRLYALKGCCGKLSKSYCCCFLPPLFSWESRVTTKECSAFKVQCSCCDFNAKGIRPKANVEPRGKAIM